MNLGRQPSTAKPLCVCKEVPQRLSSVVDPATPDVGRVVSSKPAFPQWAVVGRNSVKQRSSSLAVLTKAGCWRGPRAGAQLWARPGAAAASE